MKRLVILMTVFKTLPWKSSTVGGKTDDRMYAVTVCENWTEYTPPLVL